MTIQNRVQSWAGIVQANRGEIHIFGFLLATHAAARLKQLAGDCAAAGDADGILARPAALRSALGSMREKGQAILDAAIRPPEIDSWTQSNAPEMQAAEMLDAIFAIEDPLDQSRAAIMLTDYVAILADFHSVRLELTDIEERHTTDQIRAQIAASSAALEAVATEFRESRLFLDVDGLARAILAHVTEGGPEEARRWVRSHPEALKISPQGQNEGLPERVMDGIVKLFSAASVNTRRGKRFMAKTANRDRIERMIAAANDLSAARRRLETRKFTLSERRKAIAREAEMMASARDRLYQLLAQYERILSRGE